MDDKTSEDKLTHSSFVSLRLTREGWIYLVVLLFIAVGGLFRNINLLILLNGLMIAPLLIGWRLGVSMVQRLAAKRSLPKICFADQPFDVNWEIKNERSSLGAWQLVLRDQCHPATQQLTWKKRKTIRLLFPFIRPNESEFQSYVAVFSKRGEYEFGPVLITTRFPFGLIQTATKLPQKDKIYVAPPLGKLTTSWDRRLLSRAAGLSSVKRKRGLNDDEFFALRAWRSGDSKKQIHWRTTAKFAIPMVKQFDSQTDKDFVLILDLFQPATTPGTPNEFAEMIDKILSFATTVFLRLKGNVYGQISVAICGQELTIHTDHVYARVAAEVFQSLALCQGSAGPDTLKALLEAGSLASEGTPLYVFSSRKFPTELIDQLSIDDKYRFHAIEGWIRWVVADSDEFNEIFQLNAPGDSIATPQPRPSKSLTNHV